MSAATTNSTALCSCAEFDWHRNRRLLLDMRRSDEKRLRERIAERNRVFVPRFAREEVAVLEWIKDRRNRRVPVRGQWEMRKKMNEIIAARMASTGEKVLDKRGNPWVATPDWSQAFVKNFNVREHLSCTFCFKLGHLRSYCPQADHMIEHKDVNFTDVSDVIAFQKGLDDSWVTNPHDARQSKRRRRRWNDMGVLMDPTPDQVLEREKRGSENFLCHMPLSMKERRDRSRIDEAATSQRLSVENVPLAQVHAIQAPQFADKEDRVFDWISQKKMAMEVVTVDDIKFKMLELVSPMEPTFNVDTAWFSSFFARYRLDINLVCTHCKTFGHLAHYCRADTYANFPDLTATTAVDLQERQRLMAEVYLSSLNNDIGMSFDDAQQKDVRDERTQMQQEQDLPLHVFDQNDDDILDQFIADNPEEQSETQPEHERPAEPTMTDIKRGDSEEDGDSMSQDVEEDRELEEEFRAAVADHMAEAEAELKRKRRVWFPDQERELYLWIVRAVKAGGARVTPLQIKIKMGLLVKQFTKTDIDFRREDEWLDVFMWRHMLDRSVICK